MMAAGHQEVESCESARATGSSLTPAITASVLMSSVPPLQKRRPPLACEQCRRRKIRCDRRSPCTPCSKANLPNCQYVRDDGRQGIAKAPFEAGETLFSVLEHTLGGLVPVVPGSHAQFGIQYHHQQQQQQRRQHEGQPSEVQFGQSLRTSDSLFIDSHLLDLFPVDMPMTDLPTFETPESLDDIPSWALSSQPDATSTSEPQELRELYPNFSSATAGAFYKGRFLGRSHWINYANQSSEILALVQSYEANGSEQKQWTFSRCKAIRRAIKEREDPMTNSSPLPPRSIIPAMAVSDQLVQAYLRTFQAVLPVLHLPNFLRDYSSHWKSSDSYHETFTILLLLVLSIGSCVSPQEPGFSRTSALQCIHAALKWLLGAKQKQRLSLDGLRVHCLMLLARKVNRVTSGPTYLCTGSLYRAAMHAGVPRGGKGDGGDARGLLEVEARRRLWAVIVELDLQTAMDWGSLPVVSVEDSNCPLPSNMEEISPDIVELATKDAYDTTIRPKPLDSFTPFSLQILLAETFPVRLKIARFLNDQVSECSFDAALGLSAELLDKLKKCHDLIEGYRSANAPPTAFQIRLFDLFMRRFLLSLHHPFALKAMSDPRYAYSSQICNDTSMGLLAHLSQSNEADFRQLRLRGAGVFCDVYLQSTLYLTGEMTNQINNDTYFLSNSQRSDSVRTEMREIVDKFIQLAADRIAVGETNIKRYVLVSCLLAQAKAKHEGAPVQVEVSRTLEDTLEKCGSLLQARLKAVVGARSMDEGVACGNMPEQEDIWLQCT